MIFRGNNVQISGRVSEDGMGKANISSIIKMSSASKDTSERKIATSFVQALFLQEKEKAESIPQGLL